MLRLGTIALGTIPLGTRVEIQVSEAPKFEELEEQITEGLRSAGASLLAAAWQEIEARELERRYGEVRLDRRRPRTILTRFGWVTVKRWSVQDVESGEYRFPLDEVLGLRPHQHASQWVLQLALALTACLTYRRATSQLAYLTGGIEVDHRTLWRWMKRAGEPERIMAPTRERSRISPPEAGYPEIGEREPAPSLGAPAGVVPVR